MSTKLTGVITALLTPYDAQLQVDEASLRRLVRFNISQGVDGLYVGGSTGEAFLQSTAERQRILQVVAEEARGKVALIAHVGCISTTESQHLAVAAEGFGYNAISAVTPFYYPFSFAEHCNHYRAIVEAAPKTPMVVYNIPALSGVRLSLGQISTLMQIPNVVALKQTSDNLYQMEQIRRSHPDKILYNGYDEIFLSGQMAGADGGIGSTYNVMGWRYQRIMQAVQQNDIVKAKDLQSQCNKIIDLLVETGVFRGLKTILNHMGVIDNPACRTPFLGVDPKHIPALIGVAAELDAEYKSLRD